MSFRNLVTLCPVFMSRGMKKMFTEVSQAVKISVSL